MERVEVTRQFMGICAMQACAVKDATDQEILEVCNRLNPSGTQNGWGIVEREGDSAPVQCVEHPDRLHFVVKC